MNKLSIYIDFPMKKAKVLIVLFFFTFQVSSQKNDLERLDSTYNYCLTNPSDLNGIDNLNSVLGRLYSSYSDTALYYSIKQVELAKKAGDLVLTGRAYNMWGVCVELNGMLDSSIVMYKTALSFGEQTKNQTLLIDVYNNLGIVYSYKGLFESSIEYTLKALAIAEELEDENRQGMIYNNLGLRYSELSQQDLAISYYVKAIEKNIATNHQRRLASNYSNLGRSFFMKEDYETSTNYYKKGLQLSKQENDGVNLVITYSGLAHARIKTKDFDLAKAYNDSSFAIANKVNDYFGIHMANVVEGFILQEQKQFKQAIAFLEPELIWFEEARYFSTVLEILANLGTSYHETGRESDAFESMRRLAFGKDSIYTSQKDLAMEQVAIYKRDKQEREKELLTQEIKVFENDARFQRNQRNTFIVIGSLLLILLIGLANRYLFEKRTKKALAEKNEIIEAEKNRSEELLLNILPFEVAEELKNTGQSEARDFEKVTVLFTDFKKFTEVSQLLSAKELVTEINACFKAFDEINSRYTIEKIKTIGDAYMAAGGLQTSKTTSAKDTVMAALEMQSFIRKRKAEKDLKGETAFEMRVGIHTGPVVAGIVGVKKFQYDIWGDTVNTAARMESSGEVGKVNISQATHELLKGDPDFTFENRGKIEAKGKGEIEMWFVGLS
jgi:class 3 adenylate cyclase